MRFSLVTCTRGRTHEVAALFDSLVLQKRDDFEVVLVDQNGDDRLVGIVEQFVNLFPLKHVRIESSGASRARNAGLAYATGELIGFPDDDCEYLEAYLDMIDLLFNEYPLIGGVCGNPTPDVTKQLDQDCLKAQMELDKSSLLNRCQEFTVFVRKTSLGANLYNEHLGVGANTLWGAEEGPDLLIRLVEDGVKLVFFRDLLVYHPNKISVVSRATLRRASSYARGRGCLLRMHGFPASIILNSVFRPAAGCLLHLLKLEPKRAFYYFVILSGILRGLLMSKAELAEVREGLCESTLQIHPVPLVPLGKHPLVTVLIANYNYAGFLPSALNSLIAQTYPKWQAVICDDGSTDHSIDVIREFMMREPRIELVAKSNGGQNSAFNAAYQEARGEIVSLLDADDMFDPRKIERVVERFCSDDVAGVCNHLSQVVDGAGLPKSVTMHRFLDSGWHGAEGLKRGACVYVPTTSCMSLRREIADLVLPVPAIQDRDLDGYVGMAAQFLTPIGVIQEALSSYRIHSNNMGGITEPTPQRLRYELHLIELRTSNVREFVRLRFGETLAHRIVMEENPQYIQAALKLSAIERNGVLMPKTADLIRQHPDWKWRLIWQMIFAAPVWLTRSAVPFMHRSYRLKAFIHRLIHSEQVMQT